MSNAEESPLDTGIINLLASREGVATLVCVENGNVYTVFNIAWGYDMGDVFAHVTTNVSPDVKGASIDVFCTNEVIQIRDELSDVVLFETPKGHSEH
jgi:hypothetical protein